MNLTTFEHHSLQYSVYILLSLWMPQISPMWYLVRPQLVVAMIAAMEAASLPLLLWHDIANMIPSEDALVELPGPGYNEITVTANRSWETALLNAPYTAWAW